MVKNVNLLTFNGKIIPHLNWTTFLYLFLNDTKAKQTDSLQAFDGHLNNKISLIIFHHAVNSFNKRNYNPTTINYGLSYNMYNEN